MKNILIATTSILLIFGCKTEEPQNTPTVKTLIASNITLNNASIGGEVISEGFSAATERGLVLSETNSKPSVSDTKYTSGYGIGTFSKDLDNLKVNTKYFYAAFATNTKGTSYGEFLNFTTSDYKLPIILTETPKNITNGSAELGGSVSDEGGATVSERGICYGLNPNPSISDNKIISGKGLGSFTLIAINLKDNSKFYARAFATNFKGTAYGNEQTFTTLETLRDKNTLIVEIKSNTGRIWMDRNLGASQVATSQSDEKSYGDLYQWGREADGHQLRNSSITGNRSQGDNPNSAAFIVYPSSPSDWRTTPNNNLWQGLYGKNNVCPTGFRLPTNDEWNIEINSWTTKDGDGAFKSPLKLPLSGSRNFNDGQLDYLGRNGWYWSSSVDGNMARHLGFSSGTSGMSTGNRASGVAVRCIKD
jgi:uncharacterized protein (TIGR02145 family)